MARPTRGVDARQDPARLERSSYRMVLEHDERLYGIEAGLVECVIEFGPVRAVPGAPPEIVGVFDWQGTILTVIDFPLLVGIGDVAGNRQLLRLRAPHDRVALSVPANVRLTAVRETGPAECVALPESTGATIRNIDAAKAIEELEARMREDG